MSGRHSEIKYTSHPVSLARENFDVARLVVAILEMIFEDERHMYALKIANNFYINGRFIHYQVQRFLYGRVSECVRPCVHMCVFVFVEFKV